jgi:hypothetical protein
MFNGTGDYKIFFPPAVREDLFAILENLFHFATGPHHLFAILENMLHFATGPRPSRCFNTQLALAAYLSPLNSY